MSVYRDIHLVKAERNFRIIFVVEFSTQRVQDFKRLCRTFHFLVYTMLRRKHCCTQEIFLVFMSQRYTSLFLAAP